jgi:hypothetical protein
VQRWVTDHNEFNASGQSIRLIQQALEDLEPGLKLSTVDLTIGDVIEINHWRSVQLLNNQSHVQPLNALARLTDCAPTLVCEAITRLESDILRVQSLEYNGNANRGDEEQDISSAPIEGRSAGTFTLRSSVSQAHESPAVEPSTPSIKRDWLEQNSRLTTKGLLGNSNSLGLYKTHISKPCTQAELIEYAQNHRLRVNANNQLNMIVATHKWNFLREADKASWVIKAKALRESQISGQPFCWISQMQLSDVLQRCASRSKSINDFTCRGNQIMGTDQQC